MKRHFSGAASVILALSAFAAPADAQVFIGGGRGIVVDAPGAFVRVAPLRGGITVLPRYAPVYAQPVPPPLPSAAEILQLSDADLLNAVLALTARLDADLGRFTSASSWRNYLRLPSDALPRPTGGEVVIGIDSLKRTLDRYASAAEDPAFRQITGLPTFTAAHAALTEAVRRFDAAGSPSAAEPSVPPANSGSTGEELPRPAPALVPPQRPPVVPPQNSPGIPPQSSAEVERSIISKEVSPAEAPSVSCLEDKPQQWDKPGKFRCKSCAATSDKKKKLCKPAKIDKKK